MNLIIFDMDGTLINSSLAIANTVNYVRENLGFEKFENDFILEKVNDPHINASEFFYGTKEFTNEQTVLFEEYYNIHCLTDLLVYDGIIKLLNDLKDRGFILAVATNANSQYAKKMLTHVGIIDYFSAVLGYDSVEKPKPDAQMVNKILEQFNVKKENAQLVGDSKKDTMAAKNAGVDAVLVNWGFSNHEENAIENIVELEMAIFDKFKK